MRQDMKIFLLLLTEDTVKKYWQPEPGALPTNHAKTIM